MNKLFIAIVLTKELGIKIIRGSSGIPKRTLYIEFINVNNKFSFEEQSILDYYYSFNTLDDIIDIAKEYHYNYCIESFKELKNIKKVKNLNVPDNPIKAGQIVHFIDGDYHLGLVLNAGSKLSYILMVTSNPNWHPRARRISQDEFNLLGMPQRKISYFAPISRPNEDLVPTELNYPEHRILTLLNEFK